MNKSAFIRIFFGKITLKKLKMARFLFSSSYLFIWLIYLILFIFDKFDLFQGICSKFGLTKGNDGLAPKKSNVWQFAKIYTRVRGKTETLSSEKFNTSLFLNRCLVSEMIGKVYVFARLKTTWGDSWSVWSLHKSRGLISARHQYIFLHEDPFLPHQSCGCPIFKIRKNRPCNCVPKNRTNKLLHQQKIAKLMEKSLDN